MTVEFRIEQTPPLKIALDILVSRHIIPKGQMCSETAEGEVDRWLR
jgi:hypothetical protein